MFGTIADWNDLSNGALNIFEVNDNNPGINGSTVLKSVLAVYAKLLDPESTLGHGKSDKTWQRAAHGLLTWHSQASDYATQDRSQATWIWVGESDGEDSENSPEPDVWSELRGAAFSWNDEGNPLYEPGPYLNGLEVGDELEYFDGWLYYPLDISYQF